jgi:hypothetical protein
MCKRVAVLSETLRAESQQNNVTPEWAPAHVVGSSLIFHPTVFNLTLPVSRPGSMVRDV